MVHGYKVNKHVATLQRWCLLLTQCISVERGALLIDTAPLQVLTDTKCISTAVVL